MSSYWKEVQAAKTWENRIDAVPEWFKKTVSSNNWGEWFDNSNNTQNPLTDEQMVKSILDHEYFEEKGFFQDIVAWLRRNAPKKLWEALLWIYPLRHAKLTYKHLCELVYRMGFKASEIIERRMILGETNEWVREYFKDFPVEK